MGASAGMDLFNAIAHNDVAVIEQIVKTRPEEVARLAEDPGLLRRVLETTASTGDLRCVRAVAGALKGAVGAVSPDQQQQQQKSPSCFSPIAPALEAFARGEFLVVLDNEGRENEGDLIIAGEKMTPEAMAFMVRYTSGVVCAPTTSSRLDELDLPQMVHNNTENHRTAFTVSIDYKHNTSTGISAADRALTVRKMCATPYKDEPLAKAVDFNRPGHIFPLRARDGGVLERDGHTEAAVDLCKLSGCYPVAAICEICNDDGTMMRRDELAVFAKQHGLLMITIEDLIEYRKTKGV